MKMESILTSKGPRVVSITPNQPISDAVRLLAEHNIGALLVLDGPGAPVGIISERDIVRECCRVEDILVQSVSVVMTRQPVCGTPQDDVDAVLRKMTDGHFRHLPVMDGEALVGVVSIGDLVKAQLDIYRGEIDTLQTQIMSSETR